MIKGNLVKHAERLLASREQFVLATVVRAAAPTSVGPGDSALVLADGTIEGFVGGACAQASVRLHAVRAMETGEAILLRLAPGASSPEDDPVAQDSVVVVNNPCLSGGALEIFLEPQLPPPRVVVAGDTPIARALEDVARAAGFDVVRGDPSEVLPRPADAAMIVASHGTDEEIALTRALEAGVGYVGLVASDVRGNAVREALDVSEALRAELHTPAGLDIGERTPSEVAISILAQIVTDRTPSPAGTEPQPGERPSTAIDPVCGMEVVATDATIHLDADGRRLYFCCEGCRSRYVAQHADDAAGR
jgi:xanthine dehydrogenase accessory factor